jgi:PAS domain S-box-containing protein
MKLKKILSHGSASDAIAAICSAAQQEIGVYDSQGSLLFGTIGRPDDKRFLIDANIGYVTGQEAAKASALMLKALSEIELEKKTIAKETLNKYREITLIYDIAEKITSSLELNKILAILVDEAKRLVKTTSVEVYLINNEDNSLYLATPTEDISIKQKPREIFLEIFNKVITGGRAEIVNNFLQSSETSLICLPLRNKNIAIGALLVQNKKRDVYTSEDAKLLSVLSAHAAIAIDNARLYEEILKTNDFLERRVQDRTVKLTEINALLQLEIIERKSTADKLKNAQKYSQSLIESSLDMIISTDQSGNIVEFNMAAQKAFGYSPDEIIGKPTGILYSDRKVGLMIKERLRQNGQFSDEIVSITKDGRQFPVFISASLLKDSEGIIIGSMGVSRDITNQKDAEERLKSAMDDAERANRAKSEFLANMSHEIRTPMNGIIGMTALTLETQLNDEQREYLEMVKLSADSLLDIINSILDLSKIEAGRLTLEMTNLDLQDTIEQACSALVLQAHTKGLELLYHIYPDVPLKLIGDPTRIRQIIINLIGNAIKFTDIGDILVTLKRIDNQSILDTAVIEFSVTDSGIGIPEDKIDMVFESFAQADTSTTRRYGGTGLGLTITKQLIELMGGQIKVKSLINAGTTFLFSITFKQQPHSDDKPKYFPDISALIIDDNSLHLRILREMLTSIGSQVTEAGDSDSALLLLTKHFEEGNPFKVVIVSGKMMGLNTVVSHLRDNPQQAEIKIITLNTNHSSGEIERFHMHGFTGHLFKPIKKSRLIELISPSAVSENVLEVQGGLNGVDTRQLKILLAEDIYVNQRLALALLKKRGHLVEVANNGKEAVALLTDNLDLILMDIHMPEMDGITATKIIRMTSNIPIIALTADAMSEDRDKCLKAGMNGFVSKPIKESELFAEINRLELNRDRPYLIDNDLKNESVTHQLNRVYPHLILDKDEVMERLNGDEELFREIFDAFLIDAQNLIDSLKVSQGDPVKIKSIAHALKGASAGIGATRLREKAQSLQNLANDKDLTNVLTFTKDLQEEFNKLIDKHI